MKKLMTMVATVAFVAVFALNVQVSFDATGKTSDVTTLDLQICNVLANEGGGCYSTISCPYGWSSGSGSCCTSYSGITGMQYRAY